MNYSNSSRDERQGIPGLHRYTPDLAVSRHTSGCEFRIELALECGRILRQQAERVLPVHLAQDLLGQINSLDLPAALS